MSAEPHRKRILVVDDEESLRHMLSVLLRKQGYSVDTAENGKDALAKVGNAGYEFILSDIIMPEMDGKCFLQEAVRRRVPATIIMMSAYGTVDTAIECMKLGAYDYVSKPFKNDEIILVLKKAEERERLKEENSRLKAEINREYTFADIISRAPRMQEVFGLVRKLCNVKTTVLVQGESGTGKELIARALHSTGSRRHAPFVAVNCGAIPESLLESELFGHVKGAFTDAVSDKAGLFEQADGGTLFLDEIGEMPLSLQVKLLRVIQDEEIKRVGGTTAKKVNVRVVSATARRLDEEVAAGRFREDLFFRLNVFTISLPPLRERVEDIPLLIDIFIDKYAHTFGKSVGNCTAEARKALAAYTWPGNIRELENVVERGVILCDHDLLGLECLPPQIAGDNDLLGHFALAADSLSIKQSEIVLERELIRRALNKTNGNRTHAARLLEISHRALLYKLKEYGIE
ncbi:sigma-54-dependent transcriptional regulator [Geobacter argillaceus]|uniref:sigma-54-dependent transcriptional regulator n=1 Tax=Geobacter argillaceus TaxID=345631 RepID=UPI002482CC61|nr:sigma-54 dependent transcriptional regulator [Geobacter argillaceus]